MVDDADDGSWVSKQYSSELSRTRGHDCPCSQGDPGGYPDQTRMSESRQMNPEKKKRNGTDKRDTSTYL